jgi:hypothetical protein
MTHFTTSPAKSGVLRGYAVTCDTAETAARVAATIAEATGHEISKNSSTRNVWVSGNTVEFTTTRDKFTAADRALNSLRVELDSEAKCAAGVVDLGERRRVVAATPAPTQDAVRVVTPIEKTAPQSIVRDGRTLEFTGYGRSWVVRHDDFCTYGIDPTCSGEIRYAYYR